MPPLSERVTLDLKPLDIARVQLDRAITLFLSGEDYVSAATLGGAAEVVLGDLLRREGRSHSLDGQVKESMEVTRELDPEDRSKRSDLIRLINYFRDRLKHLGSGETLRYSVDYEAACLIQRACENYQLLTSAETETMTRFREFRYFGPDI